MTVTEYGVEQAEQALLKTSMKNLYDPAFFNIIKQLLLTGNDENIAIFKAFTYKNSLRFEIILRENPCIEMINYLVDEINKLVSVCTKGNILLWYSQINGFSNTLLDRLGEYVDPYPFLCSV